ncbi:MAG: DUF6465 family protein [Clostridiaceae bacterium]|nr:DUF6465 family protein [Clostridiaceae bacterium]
MARPRKTTNKSKQTSAPVVKTASAAPAKTETVVKPAETKPEKKEDVAAEASKVAAVVKPEEKKPVEKKEEVKVTPVETKTEEKSAEEEKQTAKRGPKKGSKRAVVEKIEEVFVEYEGQQYLTNAIVDRIKEQYKADGHRIAAIKTLRVYVNMHDHKAYYVINDKVEGFVELV